MTHHIQYLGTADIARILEISRVRAWKMIQEKKLEGERIGRCWAVKASEVRRYLREQGKEDLLGEMGL